MLASIPLLQILTIAQNRRKATVNNSILLLKANTRLNKVDMVNLLRRRANIPRKEGISKVVIHHSKAVTDNLRRRSILHPVLLILLRAATLLLHSNLRTAAIKLLLSSISSTVLPRPGSMAHLRLNSHTASKANMALPLSNLMVRPRRKTMAHPPAPQHQLHLVMARPKSFNGMRIQMLRLYVRP